MMRVMHQPPRRQRRQRLGVHTVIVTTTVVAVATAALLLLSSTVAAAAVAAAAAATDKNTTATTTSTTKKNDNRIQQDEMVCHEDGTCHRIINVTSTEEDADLAGKETPLPGYATANNHLQCTVYMAPSTLGESTSMGIYTGIPVIPGQVINFPEIAIPILFREFGEHVDGYQDGVLWDRYIWEGYVMDIETYTDTNRDDRRSVFVPGIGCTVNSVMDMCNIESTHGSDYIVGGLHRSKDPGVGAYTPYHNSQTIASATLPAGAELFATYGDYWIPNIPGAQITLEPYLEEADTFLEEQYYPFIEQHAQELTTEMKQGLWDFTTNDFPIYSKAFTNLPRGSNVKWEDIESMIVQKRTIRQEQEAAKKNKKKKKEDDDEDEEDEEPTPQAKETAVREFIRQQSVRQLEWLEEYGYCQDHIKPGRSTIAQAGFGAFAYRTLPKGTIVGYAPLVHVGLYGLDIWTVAVGEEKEGNPPPKQQYDLILNYSFGHRNSTVLLTPYGGGVNYINHGGPTKANVRIQWPSKELIAHKPEFLTRTPFNLSHSLDKIGLSFEYVALRDIQEGEEILLDYGTDWQEAWDKHVASWEPVPNATSYIHRSEWKEKYYRTQNEQSTNPYPSNLILMCLESYTTNIDTGVHYWLEPLRTPSTRHYCSVLERYGGTSSSDEEEKEEDDHLYTVMIEYDDGSDAITVENVPSSGIYLYDKSFSADWHLPNVFRHEIMIPDDILPDVWKNGPNPKPRLS